MPGQLHQNVDTMSASLLQLAREQCTGQASSHKGMRGVSPAAASCAEARRDRSNVNSSSVSAQEPSVLRSWFSTLSTALRQ